MQTRYEAKLQEVIAKARAEVKELQRELITAATASQVESDAQAARIERLLMAINW